jgi:hypothetical protein
VQYTIVAPATVTWANIKRSVAKVRQLGAGNVYILDHINTVVPKLTQGRTDGAGDLLTGSTALGLTARQQVVDADSTSICDGFPMNGMRPSA